MSEPSEQPQLLDINIGDCDGLAHSGEVSVHDSSSGTLEGAEGSGEPGESSGYADEGFAH
jgi:hypothetical protein